MENPQQFCSHQNNNSALNSSHAAVVTSSSTTTASASCLRGTTYSEPQQLLSYSSECSMLGPSGSSRTYSDQAGGKPHMSLQTLNLPTQDQGGPSFAPCSPMLPKNGSRRPGIWSGTTLNGPPKDWINGRNAMMEMDCQNLPSDYSSALLDQVPAPLSDPYRVPGGLARYHSAPSALLQSLADFQTDVVPRPMSQLENSLSSFFSDADLPPLDPANDSSLEQMETEQSANSVYDKYLLNTRKFERLGKPGAHYEQLGSGNGPIKPPIIQSVYKHSMEVLHENVPGNAQMNPQMNPQMSPQMNNQMNSQMPPSSQMPSSMGLSSSMALSSTMGLLGQQDNMHTGQQMALGNLGQGIGNDFIGASGTLAGLSSTRLSNKGNNNNTNNSLLRQSSSPAGLLAQLSIDVQAMAGAAKSEKQSLSSPLAHSPAESLSGGTSEENGGAGTGPGTPGMMSRMDVGAWEDAQSYLNSWDTNNFARKRFRDMEMDPLGDSFLTDPQRNAQDNNPPTLTRHMSLPTQKSKNSSLADDILQSVPCRIRAKRGCATHPRSIAERVRRTRISERMRKLQELVPNMDKQTNTADMLDEAVEYVKQLQRQVQELTESKCKGNCREHKDSNNNSSS